MNGYIETNKIDQIQRLHRESEVGRRFLDWASLRQNDAIETSVERASLVTGSAQKEVRNFLKEMDGLGLGKLIEGRKGYKTRFKWNYSLKSIGKAATKQVEVLKEVDVGEVDVAEESMKKSVEPTKEAAEQDGGGMINHAFQIRSSLSITVSLPNDLTAKEAERISAWVKTLPFE